MNALSHQSTFSLSNHACTRMAQRGVQSQALDILLIHGVRTKAVGGCERYRLLDRTVQQLEAEGYDAQMIEAARKLRAIVSADGAVVTCYRGASKARKAQARMSPPDTCFGLF